MSDLSGLRKQVAECLDNAYKRGYKAGRQVGREEMQKPSDIVHCRECKYADCGGVAVYCKAWAWHHSMGQDGFCGYGEREENRDE